MTTIQLTEFKDGRKTRYILKVNDQNVYHPFVDEGHAKAKAFDECCIAMNSGDQIRVSYLSIEKPCPVS